ncbi:hypothetical protein M0657_007307 [Pyricularia oryzae]|nr:hypothetical protein M9X92_006970 [Pyricularia oryzae]KAI7919014.1 hypothetical protein M0657_007307 [Pyricularia oryzae]QBZ65679.1 hypothetical protein PoMZ_12642 [Pyricularia oryzae]
MPCRRSRDPDVTNLTVYLEERGFATANASVRKYARHTGDDLSRGTSSDSTIPLSSGQHGTGVVNPPEVEGPDFQVVWTPGRKAAAECRAIEQCRLLLAGCQLFAIDGQIPE